MLDHLATSNSMVVLNNKGSFAYIVSFITARENAIGAIILRSRAHSRWTCSCLRDNQLAPLGQSAGNLAHGSTSCIIMKYKGYTTDEFLNYAVQLRNFIPTRCRANSSPGRLKDRLLGSWSDLHGFQK